MNNGALTERDIKFNKFSCIFGKCHRLLRKRYYLSQSYAEKAVQSGLGKSNSMHYVSLIENHKYLGSDEETIISLMISWMNEQYDKIKDRYSGPDLNPPDWLKIAVESGWETNGLYKKMSSWYEKETLILTGQDVEFDPNWRYSIFWYGLCVRLILTKYGYTILDFCDFAKVPYTVCGKILSASYYDTKNASKYIYDINFAVEKILKQNGKIVPIWVENVYSRDYRRSVKHMKEWYMETLDEDAKNRSKIG